MTQYISMPHGLILHKMDEELTFESKEALKRVLEEYEIQIKRIEQQLVLCKKDHEELRSEISRLIEENRDLFEQLSSSAQRASRNVSFDHSEAIDSLRQQLALVLEEKDTVEAMWKSSMREVDSLQEQVRQYQSGHQLALAHNRLSDVQKDYTEAIKLLESKLSSLKTENDQLTVKSQFHEDKLMQVTSQMALVTDKNLSLNNELKEARNQELELKSRCLTLEAQYIELDKTYEIDRRKFARVYEYDKVEAQLKNKLEETVRQRDELQAALERCHEQMAELLRNSANDRTRVEEAVVVAESAVRYREEAFTQQTALAEEVKKLTADLDRLTGEAARQVEQETAALRRQYDLELTALKDQLRVLQQERDRKCVEVGQLQKESERLQGLADQSRLPAGTNSYRRDQQLERAYQELERSETDCQQLQAENQALHTSLDKLQHRYTRNSKVKKKLRRLVASLEQQSQLYQYELTVTSQRAESLAIQVDQANLELIQLQSETFLHRDSTESVVKTLQLYKQLEESYGHMNDKWRNEMKRITDKFEAKVKKIKSQTKNILKKEDNAKVSDGQSKLG